MLGAVAGRLDVSGEPPQGPPTFPRVLMKAKISAEGPSHEDNASGVRSRGDVWSSTGRISGVLGSPRR